jgi:hypothetical protein
MAERKNVPFQISPRSCAQMVKFRDEMIASLRDQGHITKVELPFTNDLADLLGAKEGTPYYIVKRATAIATVELEFAKRYTEQYYIEHPEISAKKS